VAEHRSRNLTDAIEHVHSGRAPRIRAGGRIQIGGPLCLALSKSPACVRPRTDTV